MVKLVSKGERRMSLGVTAYHTHSHRERHQGSQEAEDRSPGEI